MKDLERLESIARAALAALGIRYDGCDPVQRLADEAVYLNERLHCVVMGDRP